MAPSGQPAGTALTCATALGLPRSFPALPNAERNRLWNQILDGLTTRQNAIIEQEGRTLGETGVLLERQALVSEQQRRHDPRGLGESERQVEEQFRQAVNRFTGRATDGGSSSRLPNRSTPAYVEIPSSASVVDPDLQKMLESHEQRVEAINGLFDDYDDLTRCEYSRLKSEMQRLFEGMSLKARCNYTPASRRDGWRYYKWLRTFFRGRNTNLDPVTILNNVETEHEWRKNPVKFLGRIRIVGGLHANMIAILRRAEALVNALKAAGDPLADVLLLTAIGVDRIGGFNPRPLNECTNLSPHSVGKAVDIDHPRNPFWRGTKMRTLDALLDYLDPGQILFGRLSRSLRANTTAGGSLYQQGKVMGSQLHAISRVIQGFLTNDEIETISKLKKLSPKKIDQLASKGATPLTIVRYKLRSAFSKRELTTISSGGIVTLPIGLFAIMKAAGAKLGIEFIRGKDVMHFEVPNWATQLQ